jgi:H+/Cl- antiporter ClcA
MFETDVGDVAEWAVADLVVSAVDQAGRSPRRWFVLLGTALVGALAVLWLARRVTIDPDGPGPDDAGPAEPAHVS